MKLTKVEHVFFDLDHTLWDFDRNSALAFQEIFAEHSIGLEVNKFLEVYMPVNFKYWELYRNDAVSKEGLRYGRLKDSFDKLNFETSDVTINSIADLYIQYLPKNNHLLDGTQEILEHLNKKYELHIITNGFEEVQHQKMKTSGIYDFFRTITTSEAAGAKKPHPQIFDLAIEQSGACPTNSVMIGDNLEADIIGAHKYGLKAIYLNPGNHDLQAEYIQIKKLKELLNYL